MVTLVFSPPRDEEESQALSVYCMVLVAVFVRHVEERVHKRISHEQEVEVLEDLNNLVLPSHSSNIVIREWSYSSVIVIRDASLLLISLCTFEYLLTKSPCLQTSLLQLIWGLVRGLEVRMVDFRIVPD